MNARTEGLRVKLSADMMLRLESISHSFGMPTSTLAAFAIAEFVNRAEANRAMQSNVVASMTNMVENLVTKPEFLSVISSDMAPQRAGLE